MKKRVSVTALVILLTSCGGGGGGNTTPVPVVTSTATPAPAASGTKTVTVGPSATSAPLPSVGGFNGSVILPPASAPGTIEIDESVAPPNAVPVLATRRRSSNTASSSSANTPFLYFLIGADSALSIDGNLSLDMQTPAGVSYAQPFYLAALYSDGTWGTVAGPATPSGGSLSLTVPVTVQFSGYDAFVLALYSGSVIYPGPPVVTTPSSIALMDLTATQTLTISGNNPNAVYSIDASRCAGVASISKSSNTVYQVSAAALGTCNLIVSDDKAHSISVYVTVTTTSVVVV